MVNSFNINKENIVQKIEIISEESEVRVDVYLSRLINRSRNFCGNLISDKLVCVNDSFIKPSYKVKKGDKLNIVVPKETEPDLTPKKIDFEILYETKDFAIINKPAGITVHPAPGNYDNTLVNGLIYHFKLEGFDDIRPGIVHRLDKDTSGLMIIAKHGEAKEKLSALFEKRLIEKAYLAVCYGNPSWETKTIELCMGRSHSDRKKMAVRRDGRYSKSVIKVIWRSSNIFLAKIFIYTGRTHQIRLHMSHLGFPLIGDEVYGNKLSKKINFDRQALHSSFLKFNNPFDKKDVICFSELPNDIMIFLSKFGFKRDENFCNFFI
jgi:23S rRNA pseudouridine1911/1915/1917 synthase